MKSLALTSVLCLVSAVASAAPPPMTRDAIMTRGAPITGFSYWWGHGRWNTTHSSVGSCSGNCPSCTHGGSNGADCSGFVAKAWQVPSASAVTTDGHPYSTVNFRNSTTYWSRVSRGSLLKADALVHNESGSGHIVLFDHGDGWGSMVTYECKGCSYGCVHGSRTATSNYIGIRRDALTAPSSSSSSSSGGTTPPPPTNHPPRGYLDGASCGAVEGWAQDPDLPTGAISVHISIDGTEGAAGARTVAVSANLARPDLCTAVGSCNHGFRFVPPPALLDGRPHAVYAYALDTAGGPKVLLTGAPKTFTCAIPTPPLKAEQGVRRHLANPTVMAAWHLTGDDVVTLPDSVVATYAEGEALTAAPRLAKAPSDATIWLLDGIARRAVPSMDAMAAWRFDTASVTASTPVQLGQLLTAHPLMATPFVFRGSGPAIYVLDFPPALAASWSDTGLPDEIQVGTTVSVTLSAVNTGSAAWSAGQVHLGISEPRDSMSPLCDVDSWLACNRPAALEDNTAPGDVGSFVFKLLAQPADAGKSVRICVGLLIDGVRWFSDAGQGGPAANALCKDVKVVARPVGAATPDAPSEAPAASCASSTADASALLGLLGLLLVRRRR